MSRPVYLVVYHSRLFAAHWSLWIPKYENETVKDLGTIIQVEGDPSGGFHHEFKRNYNVSLTRQTTSVILLGWVDRRNIIDPPGNVASIDSTATDVIEDWAVSVQAPGPSLRSASASVCAFHALISLGLGLILVCL